MNYDSITNITFSQILPFLSESNLISGTNIKEA